MHNDANKVSYYGVRELNIMMISFLSRNNIPFVRLDGTLTQQQREKVIRQFSEDSDILVGDLFPLTFSLLIFDLENLVEWFKLMTSETYFSHQVLLMSLKAGGVGINLTAASNAFVMVCAN